MIYWQSIYTEHRPICAMFAYDKLSVHLYRTYTCMCYVCLWYTNSQSIPNIFLYVLCLLMMYWQSIYTECIPVCAMFAYDILSVHLYRTYTCMCCVCLWYTDSPSIPNICLYVLCLLMIYWQSIYTEHIPVCVMFAYDILTVHLYRTYTCLCYVCLWYTDNQSIPNIFLYVLCLLMIYWQSIYTEHIPVFVMFAYDILSVHLYRIYTSMCYVCLWYTDSPSIPNIDLYVLCLLIIYCQSIYTEHIPVCAVFAYDKLTVHLYRTYSCTCYVCLWYTDSQSIPNIDLYVLCLLMIYWQSIYTEHIPVCVVFAYDILTVHLYRTYACMCYVCLWYTDSPSIPNIYLYVLCLLMIYWQSIYTEHIPVRAMFAYDILSVHLYRTYTCMCYVCLWYTDSPSIPNIDLYVLCLLMIYWQSIYTERIPVCAMFAYDILTVHLYRTYTCRC